MKRSHCESQWVLGRFGDVGQPNKSSSVAAVSTVLTRQYSDAYPVILLLNRDCSLAYPAILPLQSAKGFIKQYFHCTGIYPAILPLHRDLSGK